MEVKFLENDGRCKWLNKAFLQQLVPLMQKSKQENGEKKIVMIEDWISNDNGKVGLDLDWLDSLNITVVKSYTDITDDSYTVVNSGYDSIVDEEILLRQQGVEIIDKPCPFVRKLRNVFDNPNKELQYIFLCEPNHIVMKNFRSIFPDDMILVQMENYKECIANLQNGKPLCLVPYVTFLPKQVQEIYDHIQNTYPNAKNEFIKASCMWVASQFSPVVEINNFTEEDLDGITDALLITTPGSVNKSLLSLKMTLEDKGLNVFIISSLDDYVSYENNHQHSKILLVRSPIPNNVESPIMDYIKASSKG